MSCNMREHERAAVSESGFLWDGFLKKRADSAMEAGICRNTLFVVAFLF